MASCFLLVDLPTGVHGPQNEFIIVVANSVKCGQHREEADYYFFSFSTYKYLPCATSSRTYIRTTNTVITTRKTSELLLLLSQNFGMGNTHGAFLVHSRYLYHGVIG